MAVNKIIDKTEPWQDVTYADIEWFNRTFHGRDDYKEFFGNQDVDIPQREAEVKTLQRRLEVSKEIATSTWNAVASRPFGDDQLTNLGKYFLRKVAHEKGHLAAIKEELKGVDLSDLTVGEVMDLPSVGLYHDDRKSNVEAMQSTIPNDEIVDLVMKAAHAQRDVAVLLSQFDISTFYYDDGLPNAIKEAQRYLTVTDYINSHGSSVAVSEYVDNRLDSNQISNIALLRKLMYLIVFAGFMAFLGDKAFHMHSTKDFSRTGCIILFTIVAVIGLLSFYSLFNAYIDRRRFSIWLNKSGVEK